MFNGLACGRFLAFLAPAAQPLCENFSPFFCADIRLENQTQNFRSCYRRRASSPAPKKLKIVSQSWSRFVNFMLVEF
ncbi:MAG: hypothetical protein PUB35_06620 [Campylobacteraceae bacterium]|nr:hypothetical protein [Campylobacteraceae bacterium]